MKNESLIENSDAIDINPLTSKITITPYRAFVGTHVDQHFYYKPVMDTLDYAPAKISPEKASVLIEGKTDFYCIQYFKNVYFKDRFKLEFFPGGGSGALDPIISILCGWGINFIILLDEDESGIKEKTRYETKFETLVKNRIVTLAEALDISKNQNREIILRRGSRINTY